MNRLFCLIGIALMLLAGCTGRLPGSSGVEAPVGNSSRKVVVEHEFASLPSTTPVSSEVIELLSADPTPVLDSLPELPTGDLPTKLPSGLTEFWNNGNVDYMKSPNALEVGSTMELEAVEGNSAWVIYQIPNLLPLTEISQLSIELSDAIFGGSDPGYWTGIANYDKGSWQILARSQASPLKTFSIPASEPYISTANNFYLFIMLTGDQSVTIERVGLEVNTPAWVEVIVDDDTADGVSTGWMPAITFDRLNNPVIAYAELGTGIPRLAVCNRDAGLGDPGNWTLTYIDLDPEDSGDLIKDIGAKAKWLDITIDEVNGMPRVSMIYDEIQDKEESSRAGISVMFPDGRWLNYRLGWIDEAEWTSIDSIPGTSVYGLATHAKNTNWAPSRPPYDFTYITFDIYDVDQVFDLYRDFGENWRYPHLKYDPNGGAGVVGVYGSQGYYEQDSENWDLFYGDPQSGEFGSLAINPVSDQFGSTYVREQAAQWDLIYVSYDAGFVGDSEVVDTLARTIGVERIGDISQLAYRPNGTPAIAYTVFDGNFVEIKYAQKSGDVWESSVISVEPILVESPNDRFVLDLAIDDAGVPVVCYHHRNTQGDHSLRVVFNED